MKRYISLLSVVLVILVLAACGPAATPEPAEAPAAPAATPLPPTATAPEGVGGGGPDPSGDNTATREAFEGEVIRAVVERDFAAMPGLMLDKFFIAGWQAEGSDLSPADAVEQLKTFYPPEGNIVTFGGMANIDLTSLLGQNPADFFGGGVSFLYSVGWGPNGNGEAIFVVDSRDGVLYLSGVLFALNRFDNSGASDTSSAPGASAPTGDNTGFREAFEQEVIRAVVEHDFAAMQSSMLNEFSIAGWSAGAAVYSPADAIEQLKTFYPPEGNIVTFGASQSVDLTAKLGQNPADFFGGGVSFLYSVGWGPNGNGEAILVIDVTSDGVLYWSSVLFALNGF